MVIACADHDLFISFDQFFSSLADAKFNNVVCDALPGMVLEKAAQRCSRHIGDIREVFEFDLFGVVFVDIGTNRFNSSRTGCLLYPGKILFGYRPDFRIYGQFVQKIQEGGHDEETCRFAGKGVEKRLGLKYGGQGKFDAGFCKFKHPFDACELFF